MLNFSYANPTRLVFGRSAEHEVGRVMTSILRRPGKVLVLFGGGSAHRTGILGAVEDSLQESGFAVIEMGGVQPNPRMGFVRDTIDWVRDQGIRAVVAVGGGGIPVIRRDGRLSGTPAVIDKDFGSELLAELLDADMLIILTAVEKVAINFNKPDQRGLDDLTPAEARRYMDEGQFAKGSMLPKVEAAVKFAESKPGRTALITLLEKAKDGIEGKTGTRVHQ